MSEKSVTDADGLRQILELHAAWLATREGGKCADLRHADLRHADLRGAVLSHAVLSHAVLSHAVLSHADLRVADLRGADLRYADLRVANLGYANLSGANLRVADLSHANLGYANLSGADADLALAQLSIVPELGPFVGWKKCRDNVIAKLEIGAEAKRSNASGRKCRAEYVKVLEVIGAEVGIGLRDETEYRVGQIVRCGKWDEHRWNECSGGIHFFLTRVEAEDY